jgi:hypothetical protein
MVARSSRRSARHASKVYLTLSQFVTELRLITVGWEGRAAGARGDGPGDAVAQAYGRAVGDVLLLLDRTTVAIGATYLRPNHPTATESFRSYP